MTSKSNVVNLNEAARGKPPGRLMIPERLTEARLAFRMTQTELANLIGVSRQAVSAYEMGEKKPDPSIMKKIAATLEQPIPYFTKTNRPNLGTRSALFFRKVGADTKRRNRACEVFSDWAVSATAALIDFVNFPVVDIPSFEPKNPHSQCYSEEEIEVAAEKVRQHFRLGWGPITNVIRLLESKGVVICRLEISGEKIEAFSFWSGGRPFIFLASDKDSAARARFDAAHELAHLCLHRWVGSVEIEDKNRLKEIESEANRFAAAFLLPRKSFPNEIYSSRVESFVDLKARWKVAIQAMIYRCKDLGLFDDRQVTNLYKQISYKKWRTSEPLDGLQGLPIEQPALLRQVIQLVLEGGKMSASELMIELAISYRILEQIYGLELSTLANQKFEMFDLSLK